LIIKREKKNLLVVITTRGAVRVRRHGFHSSSAAGRRIAAHAAGVADALIFFLQKPEKREKEMTTNKSVFEERSKDILCS
jgi:hypothetical protein